MKSLKHFIVLFTAVLVWISCNKDFSNHPDALVKASFSGLVTDASNAPIVSAKVEVGGTTVYTDENGVFRTTPVSVNADRAFVKVSADNYFTSGKLLSVKANSQQQVQIQLLAKTFSKLIPVSNGGTVSTGAGGPSVKFAANGFIDDQGAKYNHDAWVAVRHINPADDGFPLQIPGALRGIRAGSEEETSLASFGMIYVELRGVDGTALNISPDAPAEITMPIPTAQLATAPAEIPLWYFDETDGLWKEEGTAQKVGNNYVGSVHHFSCWNYDASLPSINLSGRVVDQYGNPIAGFHVWVETVSQWGVGHGNTDADGYFSGPVAKDEALILKILDYSGTFCNPFSNPLLVQNIGPFSADTQLPDIVVNLSGPNYYNISGSLVDCNGAAVTNGYVKVSSGTAWPYIVFANSSGNFNATVTICTNPQNLHITGFDPDNSRQSPTLSFGLNQQNIDTGPLTVCTLLDEYMQFTLDGANFSASDSLYSFVELQTTYISSSSFNGNNSLFFQVGNNEQTGTFAIANLYVNQYYPSNMSNMNVTATFTEFSQTPGGYIVGTLDGAFDSPAGIPHTLHANFRIKRY